MLKRRSFLILIIVIFLITLVYLYVNFRANKLSNPQNSAIKKFSQQLPQIINQYPLKSNGSIRFSIYCVLDNVSTQKIKLLADVTTTLWTTCYFYDTHMIERSLLLPLVIEQRVDTKIFNSIWYTRDNQAEYGPNFKLGPSGITNLRDNVLKLKEDSNAMLVYVSFDFLSPNHEYFPSVKAVRGMIEKLGFNYEMLLEFSKTGDIDKLPITQETGHHYLVPLGYSFEKEL
jgi:hypothetical protein